MFPLALLILFAIAPLLMLLFPGGRLSRYLGYYLVAVGSVCAVVFALLTVPIVAAHHDSLNVAAASLATTIARWLASATAVLITPAFALTGIVMLVRLARTQTRITKGRTDLMAYAAEVAGLAIATLTAVTLLDPDLVAPAQCASAQGTYAVAVMSFASIFCLPVFQSLFAASALWAMHFVRGARTQWKMSLPPARQS